MKKKVPDPARRWLNAIADNALEHARFEVGGGCDPRPKACAHVSKELEEPFYEEFMGWLKQHAMERFIHELVYGRVNQRKQHYIPKEGRAAEDEGSPSLAILHSDTTQPVWIKPTGAGGKPTPKLMSEASPEDHFEIALRREQQALLVMRKSRWHKAVVDWADRHNVSHAVARELFEIEEADSGAGASG